MMNLSSLLPQKFSGKTLVFQVAIALVLLLNLACGSDKSLSPESTLKFVRAIPDPTFVADVDPPFGHQTFFEFLVSLNDPELTTIENDAWMIDKVIATYTITSNTGGHLLFPPYGTTLAPSTHISRPKQILKPNIPTQIPEVMVPMTWIDGTDASGAQTILGTADTATIDVAIVFRFHRVRDGFIKTFNKSYTFTVEDTP